MDNDKYIGRLLDNRYEILEVLGTGGMAVVYKARCHRLNRLVAVKILKDDYSQDEEFRRRFHAESQAVAMLSHPNIVSVYDVSTSNGADYIVMELIDGITLKQYMQRKGVLNWKETLHFAIQIGKALDHAHSRGIVHRDIKPHNVMVLKNGSVKVTDFGIARVMSKSNTLTKEALGSVHYISPEQAKGGRVDSRSDIYSLGVVMYEMMTGRPPYDGESPVAVAIQHINGNAAMPSTLNPNIPGGLEQIIMKAMAQNPANRYATTSAMLYDMDEFRKNPAILFDYNNPHTDIDAAAKMANTARKKEEPAPAPKTTAERVATKPEAPKPRPEQPARKPQPAPKAKRRQEEIIEEDDERGSKVATIAVIACAVVAVVAIVLFVVAFMNGDQSTQVPGFVGMTQEQISAMELDVQIRVGDRKHNTDFAKGQVYDQNPKEGTKIAKGGTVTIFISLGPQPEEKKMEDLTLLDEATAKKFLIDGLGINENKILVHTESSSTVAAGRVTRTEPVDGEPLSDDQVVTLWISTGPEVRVEKVPNVVGRQVDKAEELLNVNGFKNIRLEHVESNKDKGIVISQSVVAQTEVDVSTEIVLEVSLGSGEEGTKPTEPPIPTRDPDEKTKTITVGLSEDMMEDYTLSLWLGGELIEEREIPVGTVSTQFQVTGKGKVKYELRINNANPWTFEVNFDEQEKNR